MADYYALLKKALASLPEPNNDLRNTIYNHARKALNNQLETLSSQTQGHDGEEERFILESAILRIETELSEAETAPYLSKTPDLSGLPDLSAQQPQQAYSAPSPLNAAEYPAAAQQSAMQSARQQTPANEKPQIINPISESESHQENAVKVEQNVVSPILSHVAPQVLATTSAPTLLTGDIPQGHGNGEHKPIEPKGFSKRISPAPTELLVPKPLRPPQSNPPQTSGAQPSAQHKNGKSDFNKSDIGFGKNGAPIVPSSLAASVAVLSEPRVAQGAPIAPIKRKQESFFLRWRVPIISFVILIIMLGIAGLAVTLKQSTPDGEKFDALAQQQSAADATPQKNTSRIGGPPPPPASNLPTVPSSVTAPAVAPTPSPASPSANALGQGQLPLAVTYRAALLVEAPAEPGQIKVNLGSVVWRFANNQVIAEITIPDVGVGIVMALRKNTDQTLPASHILAITFANLPGSNFEPVQQMDHPLMRKEEAPAGDALDGVPARITNNQFLFAFNRTPIDVARNLDLLKSREWMDVPLQLVSGKIAKLTFEKGVGGNNALTEALKSWDKLN